MNTEARRKDSSASSQDTPIMFEEIPRRSETSGAVSGWTASDFGAIKTDHPVGDATARMTAPLRPNPPRTHNTSHIRVEASVFSFNQCDQFCICQCHKVTNMATPSSLGKIIGRLFIGYIGFPLLSHRTCNRLTCRQGRSQSRIRIAYLFPLWFALRLIAVTITKASTTFTWTLSFPIVTQSSCPMLVQTSLGSIQKVQGLLATSAAVLNAIDIIASKSPLHVSVATNALKRERLIF